MVKTKFFSLFCMKLHSNAKGKKIRMKRIFKPCSELPYLSMLTDSGGSTGVSREIFTSSWSTGGSVGVLRSKFSTGRSVGMLTSGRFEVVGTACS